MQRSTRSFGRAAVALWPPLLAVVLCWPLLTRPGHPLARDLIFAPRQPWTEAVLGLGDAAPRAVPLDALVSLTTHVVDGGLLARLVVPLVLATAGWGALRLVSGAGLAGQLAAATLAVWNPYVVERLALGQWALLASYAALPWILGAAVRYRHHGRARDLGGATLWAALASLTPTGGVLALGALMAGGLGRTRRSLSVLGLGLALQGPWLAAALSASTGRTSDPAAVAVFAPDTDAPGGPVVALLGLGGVWDDASEPATRGTWLAVLAAAVTVAVVIAGLPRWRALRGADEVTRWCVLAGVATVLVVASATPWGEDLLRWAVAHVPGAGLLRDTQKLLAPTVLVCAATLGALADRVSRAWRDRPVELRVSGALALVLLPIVLLPDATTVTWPTVDPVRYPDDFEAVADVLEAGPEDRTLVTLPWRSYRRFEWGNGATSSDPALRWFDLDVLVSDDLQVGDVLVTGEGRRASEVGAALSSGSPAEVLGPLGVTWVLTYPDDPDAAGLDLAGLEPVYLGEELELYRVPEPVSAPGEVSTGRRLAVTAGWLAYLAAVLTGAAASVLGRRRSAPVRPERRVTT